MRILFIASEAFPSGAETRDVLTLATELQRADHKVQLLSPLYGHIDIGKHALARRLTKLEFELGGRAWACELYAGRTPDGVELVFIGNEEVLLPAKSLTGEGDQLDASRVGVFAAAACQYIEQHRGEVDVVHAHGWPGAAVVARLRSDAPELATVVTVYDAAQQGRFDAADDRWLELGDDAVHDGKVNVLKAGVLAADRVTTLSPNYAHKIQREEGGNGLHEVFLQAHDKLFGVRHGIDPARWNPATDKHIPARFDPYDLDGKDKCKAHLQNTFSLPVRGDIPLFTAIGRVEGDGMELLAKAGPDFLRNQVQLVVQLEGGGELVAIYEELWDRWPDNIQIKTGRDEALRHVLIAASDFVIVPGRQAPTDGLQARAQRYGALPIVHREGGLADEIVDCDPSLTTGSGLLYEQTTPESLLGALQRATALFANTKAFRALQSRTMRLDHSWERTLRLYERIYRDAAKA